MRFLQRVGLVLACSVFFLPMCVGAEAIPVADGVVLELELRPGGWQVFRQAPDFLIAETAEHLQHELAAQGKTPGEKEIRQIAEKRLAANEAFVCNPASGACLTIDFSPLRPDEKAPSQRAVAMSAKYAAEGLADEEGVTDLRQEQKKYAVSGAEIGYRVDARYRQHGEPRHFVGIIGFLNPHWFFLYYTDPQRDPADLPEMERMLRSLALQRQR